MVGSRRVVRILGWLVLEFLILVAVVGSVGNLPFADSSLAFGAFLLLGLLVLLTAPILFDSYVENRLRKRRDLELDSANEDSM